MGNGRPSSLQPWLHWARALAALGTVNICMWNKFSEALDRDSIGSKEILANQVAEARTAALTQHCVKWRWGVDPT